jgi:hypothetical protein
VFETAATMLAPDEDLGAVTRVRTFWPDFPQAAATERRVCARERAPAD